MHTQMSGSGSSVKRRHATCDRQRTRHFSEREKWMRLQKIENFRTEGTRQNLRRHGDWLKAFIRLKPLDVMRLCSRAKNHCSQRMGSHPVFSALVFACLSHASSVYGQVRFVLQFMSNGIKICLVLTVFFFNRLTGSPQILLLGSMNSTTIIWVSTATNLSKLPTQQGPIRQDGRWSFTMEMVRDAPTVPFPFRNARYHWMLELEFP